MRTMMMIKAKSAKNISRYSKFPNEKEFLLFPGTKIKVDGEAKLGNLVLFSMSEA